MNTKKLFPLVRHLSGFVMPFLLRFPISANMVTTLSLISGCACLYFVSVPSREYNIIGGIFLIISYVLDNCDGEVARAKKQCSEFGRKYDTFVDWIINSAIFVALGLNVSLAFNQSWWLWIGLAGFAGGTINYLLGMYFDSRDKDIVEIREEGVYTPQGIGEWAVYFLREISRADFCFIVFAL